MKQNLTKIVGALSIGALALAGCKSKEADAEQPATGETTAEGKSGESSCSGKGEGEKKEGEGSCGGGSCGGGK